MLVLHVGPHKTATTWLQYNFHHNIKALEQAGWYYPQTGVRVRVAHHDISDKPREVLNDRSAKVRELRRIAARASEKNLDILLSSEGFRHWQPRHLVKLQAIMAPHALHIVYCVRDPVSTLYSFWAQQVRMGQRLSFPEFNRREFDRPARSKILNPSAEIHRLSQIKEAQLTILLYDEIRRQKRDIFDVFTGDVLKIAPLPTSKEARANDRQPIEMTEFMRLVLIRIGNWRKVADTNIGRVFEYMLPKPKQDEIIAAVSAVSAAKQVSVIDRKHPFLRRMEHRLLTLYGPLMIPQPGTGRLFLDGKEECPYYDGALLEGDPAVASLLAEVTHKFRAGGWNLMLVNGFRFWLSWSRRIMKFLRG